MTVPRPVTPAPTRPPVPPISSFLRPHARGGDLDLLRWYTALRVAAATDAGAPVSSTVHLVRRRADLAGVAGLVAAAHGAIGGGQRDATGTRVAFIGAPGSLSDRSVRTWAYVVAVRDAIVLTTLAVPRQAMVLGWFGDEVVIDRSAMGLPPVLLNGAARAAPRELEHGISAVATGLAMSSSSALIWSTVSPVGGSASRRARPQCRSNLPDSVVHRWVLGSQCSKAAAQEPRAR